MFKLTVKRDAEWQEWIARVTYNGKLITSYHTEDKADALATGKMELQALRDAYADERDVRHAAVLAAIQNTEVAA